MTTYKWVNQAKGVVAVIDDDGVCRASGLASVLVPEGASVIPAAPAARDIQAEIDALERDKMLPRGTRESDMLGALKEAAILQVGVVEFYDTMNDAQRAATMLAVEPSVYAANPGYRKTKDFDDQIKALRALLPK